MISDSISDLLARLKNAYLAKKEEISVPFSKMNLAILEILVKENYIEAVSGDDQGKFKRLVIKLKYINRSPAISGIKRLSKPGRRLYSTVKDVPKSLGGYGVTIISTNQGLLTDKQAKQKNVGGELICQIW